MRKKARVALRRFRRVQDFLTTNPVDGTQVKLQVLDEVIRALAESGVEQEATTRLTQGETVRLRTLRETLWNQHMIPLARIARRVLEVPEAQAKLKLPPKRADNDRVLSVAGGMAEVAEQHVAVFVGEGLPADFIQRLRAATEALANAVPVRTTTINRKATSREASAKLLKRGVAALDVLDAIVKPRLEGQPDLLAAWRIAKRPVEVGGGSAVTPIAIEGPPVVKVA